MAVVPLRKKAEKPTIGSLIDNMSTLREQRRALAEQDKTLSGQISAIEEQLIEQMEADGMVKCTGKLASATISESTQFNVADWEVFMAYLIKSKQGHLVQRRVSAPAVAELFASKGVVPGLEPFTQRKINLRNV